MSLSGAGKDNGYGRCRLGRNVEDRDAAEEKGHVDNQSRRTRLCAFSATSTSKHGHSTSVQFCSTYDYPIKTTDEQQLAQLGDFLVEVLGRGRGGLPPRTGNGFTVDEYNCCARHCCNSAAPSSTDNVHPWCWQDLSQNSRSRRHREESSHEISCPQCGSTWRNSDTAWLYR